MANRKGLPYEAWSDQDRHLFQRVQGCANPFLGDGTTPLSQITVQGRGYTYGIFLAFLSRAFPELMTQPIEAKITRQTVEAFVHELRRDRRETTVAVHLERLFFVARRMSVESDFQYISRAAKNIKMAAPQLTRPYILSYELHELGLQGLEQPFFGSSRRDQIWYAVDYRNALLVAFAAEAPMRRRSLAGLTIPDLTKVGACWQVYARAEYAKTRKATEYELSPRLSDFMDKYLSCIRPLLPGSEAHQGLWPSRLGGSLHFQCVGRAIGDYTQQRIGMRITPQSFRRAAASTIAYADPENIYSAGDILDHSDFRITEKHYLPAARTRVAGRKLSSVLRRIAQPSHDLAG